MEYTVRRLKLNRTISISEGQTPDGTIALFEYESRVAKNDLEPAPNDHLAGGKPLSVLPAGIYLFTQGFAEKTGDPRHPDALIERLFREAAEAVWLESLWRETTLKNKRILVRILSEENNLAFQIFREITDEESQP